MTNDSRYPVRARELSSLPDAHALLIKMYDVLTDVNEELAKSSEVPPDLLGRRTRFDAPQEASSSVTLASCCLVGLVIRFHSSMVWPRIARGKPKHSCGSRFSPRVRRLGIES